jgi:oligoribonuclease NrnB/cAMP/cGMP phosphodiesterase (DHH superfamily)
MKPLCIYHGNCADGFAAAWVVRKALNGEVDFHGGVYQNPPPDVAGRKVILVDFSYKLHVMRDIAAAADGLTILDHHKSAIEDLAPMVGQIGVTTDFDLNRSGARIAWDWYFKPAECPKLIEHIEDRDLWRFRLPKTREIQAAVFSYPYDFEVWDKLMIADLDKLATEGAAIERKHHKDIAELIAVTKRSMVIGGHDVQVANLPYTMSSDAGHQMGKGEPFAACYWDTPSGRVFSLRSPDDGLDVSEIAKLYGGGGHAHASGFRMPIGWEGDEVGG